MGKKYSYLSVAMNMQKVSLPANVRLVRLKEDMVIQSFESADKDLNDFLLNDAKNYLKSLLAVTYLLQAGDKTVAYFSLSNDNLSRNNDEKSAWNKVNRTIPNEKRRSTYPAVKIGRLAVDRGYTGMGLGNRIIQIVKGIYTNELQHSGCRFLTVDAYHDALPFYQKNDFKFLTEHDTNDDTRTMYFDLKAV
jgi:predicted GNAT family N-acyltransferase